MTRFTNVAHSDSDSDGDCLEKADVGLSPGWCAASSKHEDCFCPMSGHLHWRLRANKRRSIGVPLLSAQVRSLIKTDGCRLLRLTLPQHF